jgi:hypothetical protein
VLVEGVATIIETGDERDSVAAELAEKYPQYHGGKLDGRPMVRIAVERAVSWKAS